MWRLARGLNKRILFNFLLTGHTKFSPDRYFGVFKAKYATSNIDTYEDIKNCVFASSPSGCNVPVSTKNVVWYDWVEYFKKFYKPLVGITSFHHFIITKDSVEARLFADSEETTTFELRICADDFSEPKVITPQGLPLERQWYLFKNIRNLVFDKSKADDVAPMPKEKIKKEVKIKAVEVDSDELVEKKKKKITKKTEAASSSQTARKPFKRPAAPEFKGTAKKNKSKK